MRCGASWAIRYLFLVGIRVKPGNERLASKRTVDASGYIIGGNRFIEGLTMLSVDLNPKRKRENPLLWIFEPLERDPGYSRERFFNMQAAWLDGLLYLAVASGEEPWNGLLVCTSHDRQAGLLHEYPALVPHPVLGKWLYVSQSHPEFETAVQDMVALARERDPRMGVVPGKRKRSPDVIEMKASSARKKK
jgi:hypothetical protein